VEISIAQCGLSSVTVQQLMPAVWCTALWDITAQCWRSSGTVQQLMSAVWCAALWDWVLQSVGCHQLLFSSWCLLYGVQPYGTEYYTVWAVISYCSAVDVCCMVRSPVGLSRHSVGYHQLLCNSRYLVYGAQPCIPSAQQSEWHYQSLCSCVYLCSGLVVLIFLKKCHGMELHLI
jgi:hypothetical protein